MKDKLLALFNTYWPVAAILLPSIIVALTKMPDADKEGTTLNKIVNWLKMLLQLGSFLSHKDDEGTLKLPLTAKMKRNKQTTSAVPPAPPVVLMLLLTLSAHGCADYWKSHGDTLKKDLTNCAVEAAKAGAPDLLPEVMKILQGDESTWGQAWDALKKVGGGALNCAMIAAYHDLLSQEKKMTAMPAATMDSHRKKRAAITRWLAKEKVVFTFVEGK